MSETTSAPEDYRSYTRLKYATQVAGPKDAAQSGPMITLRRANLLTAGDGAGITADRAVSFTAYEKTEILLVDLDQGLGRSPTSGGVP